MRDISAPMRLIERDRLTGSLGSLAMPQQYMMDAEVLSTADAKKICPKKAHKQQVWARVKYYIYRNSALRSTLNTNVITGLGMCKVLCMYRSSALLSTLNRNVVTGYGLV